MGNINYEIGNIFREDFTKILEDMNSVLESFKSIHIILGKHATPAGKFKTITMITTVDRMIQHIAELKYECQYQVLWHRDDEYVSFSNKVHDLIDDFKFIILSSTTIPLKAEQLTAEEAELINEKKTEIKKFLGR